MRMSLLLATILTLTVPAVAQQTNSPLSSERELDVRKSIMRAVLASDFNDERMRLEVFRTLRAAGVTLSPDEAFAMGQSARWRGLPGEASEAFALLGPDDEEFQQNTALIEGVREQAEQDRQSDLEEYVQIARLRNNPLSQGVVAELLAVSGKDEKAVELYELALGHNQQAPENLESRAAEASRLYKRSIEFYELEFREKPCGRSGSAPRLTCVEEVARLQLNYGISLFRLGRIEEARATWAAISGSPAIEILAGAWIEIANTSN